MPPVDGIHDHPIFKLGKAPAKYDSRDLLLRAVLPARAVAVPAVYDFDTTHPHIPTPMFENDTLGNCVIAGRAHQTMRFETLEQARLLSITDEEITAEYFAETGGGDDGLVVSDSLNLWRQKGWLVAGGHYSIYAYARLNPANPGEVRQAIFSHVGAGLGLQLPRSAQKQTQAGQPWSVVKGADGRPGSWGGHYVYCSGYTAAGPVCVTWGRKQQMTWGWLARYADEAFAIFDAKNVPPAVRTFIDKL